MPPSNVTLFLFVNGKSWLLYHKAIHFAATTRQLEANKIYLLSMFYFYCHILCFYFCFITFEFSHKFKKNLENPKSCYTKTYLT